MPTGWGGRSSSNAVLSNLARTAFAGPGSDAAINGLFRYAQQTIDGIYTNSNLEAGVITGSRSQ